MSAQNAPNRSTRKRSRRTRTGNAISEFGPAMLVTLVFIFFPLVDMLSILVSYSLVYVLNYNQVHEASLLPYTDATDNAGSVISGIPKVWLSGMGHFVKTTGMPGTFLSYRKGETGSDKVADKIVGVRTTVAVSPFLPIPIPWLEVPGMNKPFTFVVYQERPMENPDYAPP